MQTNFVIYLFMFMSNSAYFLMLSKKSSIHSTQHPGRCIVGVYPEKYGNVDVFQEINVEKRIRKASVLKSST